VNLDLLAEMSTEAFVNRTEGAIPWGSGAHIESATVHGLGVEVTHS
jgi:hypothetical protein